MSVLLPRERHVRHLVCESQLGARYARTACCVCHCALSSALCALSEKGLSLSLSLSESCMILATENAAVGLMMLLSMFRADMVCTANVHCNVGASARVDATHINDRENGLSHVPLVKP